MKHWSNLSLNDKEGGKMFVKKDRSSNEYTIAVKFLTKWALNIDAIGLLVLSGVPEMASRSITRVIIRFCLFLIIMRRWKKFWLVNLGVLIGISLFFKGWKLLRLFVTLLLKSLDMGTSSQYSGKFFEQRCCWGVVRSNRWSGLKLEQCWGWRRQFH